MYNEERFRTKLGGLFLEMKFNETFKLIFEGGDITEAFENESSLREAYSLIANIEMAYAGMGMECLTGFDKFQMVAEFSESFRKEFSKIDKKAQKITYDKFVEVLNK